MADSAGLLSASLAAAGCVSPVGAPLFTMCFGCEHQRGVNLELNADRNQSGESKALNLFLYLMKSRHSAFGFPIFALTDPCTSSSHTVECTPLTVSSYLPHVHRFQSVNLPDRN